ncbi:hypothetical protein WG66_003136 [Moniliophthora roreri]|nr:hypothetical protein WG66_003136 [Moniliophthora roreri]
MGKRLCVRFESITFPIVLNVAPGAPDTAVEPNCPGLWSRWAPRYGRYASAFVHDIIAWPVSPWVIGEIYSRSMGISFSTYPLARWLNEQSSHY